MIEKKYGQKLDERKREIQSKHEKVKHRGRTYIDLKFILNY